MTQVDKSVCEIMGLAHELAEQSLNPLNNDSMRDLTRKLGAALRKQAKAIEVEGI